MVVGEEGERRRSGCCMFLVAAVVVRQGVGRGRRGVGGKDHFFVG
jgi:hypothetical protein